MNPVHLIVSQENISRITGKCQNIVRGKPIKTHQKKWPTEILQGKINVFKHFLG